MSSIKIRFSVLRRHRLGEHSGTILRCNISSSSLAKKRKVVDLRSDTVTQPTPAMLQSVFTAATGDDVMGEDPSVRELEARVANLLGKPGAVYCPTGTMANLLAITAHCDRRSSEILTGASSHICLYESGNTSTAAGVYSRQLPEDALTAQFNLDQLQDAMHDSDADPHYCRTALVCVENTHNMLGGIPLDINYLRQLGVLCRSRNIRLHMDGARLGNAVAAAAARDATSTATESTWQTIAAPCDTISLCLSKGLGAPLGSVLVTSDAETEHLVRRARKRYGGGMRQAGVVAAMGLYALDHHADLLHYDHERARRLAEHLQSAGFLLMNDRLPATNMVFFGLPSNGTAERNQVFTDRLEQEHGVKISGGYSTGGKMFRAVTHLDVTDEDAECAMNAMVHVWHSMDH